MAAVSDTGTLTYYINGEPVQVVSTLSTGGLIHYVNGEPVLVIFGAAVTVNLGQFFLMF